MPLSVDRNKLFVLIYAIAHNICYFQGYDDIPKEVADPDAKKVY